MAGDGRDAALPDSGHGAMRHEPLDGDEEGEAVHWRLLTTDAVDDVAPLRRLVMATLLAAITVQQLVHARDSVEGLQPLRPASMPSSPPISP